MNTSFRLLSLLFLLLIVASPAQAQQVNDKGTKEEMPLKTAVIKDPAAENTAAFFPAITILRFWVYKAGSTTDVARIVGVLKKAPGVKEFTEGDVSGDYKEFVLELSAPQNKAWYINNLKEAGIRYIKVNNKEAVPVAEF